MATSDNKTVPTADSVDAFLDAIEDPVKQTDSKRLRDLMEATSGHPAKMWGPAIVGFGHYHYKYESGREGDTMAIGFSPRKAQISIYLAGMIPNYAALIERLGKHTTGKGCLYIKKLADVDEDVLTELIAASLRKAAELHHEPT